MIKNSKLVSLSLLVIIFIFICITKTFAQESTAFTLPGTNTYELESDISDGRTYYLSLYVPINYSQSDTANYLVLY